MDNKAKCEYLKGIRRSMADKLGLDLHQRECTFEGECSGTCPKCQQEEKTLNKALLKKGAALAGAAVMTVSLAACTPVGNDLAGDLVEQAPPAIEEQKPDIDGKDATKPAEQQKDPYNEPAQLDGDIQINEDYVE